MIYADNTRAETLPVHQQTDHDPVISTIIDFTADSLFIESAYENNVDPNDSSSEPYKKHLQDYALDYCKTLSGVESDENLTAIALFASAPLALHKKTELNRNNKEHHLKGSEYHGAKDHLVQFNFLLTKYIEQHPAENAAMLVAGLTEVTDRFNETPNKSAHDEFDAIIQGMRTEFGFEQIIRRINTISLRHADARQERRGIDFILDVPIPGKQTPVELDIDIKSSLDQVAGTAGGYDDSNNSFARDHHGNFKFYPLLPKSAYENGSFLVKEEYVNQLIPQIGKQLFLMAKSI